MTYFTSHEKIRWAMFLPYNFERNLRHFVTSGAKLIMPNRRSVRLIPQEPGFPAVGAGLLLCCKFE